ncbi:MAG: hypothetical protein ABI281_10825 [Caldimonas sp.]
MSDDTNDRLRGFGLALIEIPVAIGLGFAIFVATWTLGCRVISRCYDTSGAGWAILGMLGAVMGGGIFWFKVVRMDARSSKRRNWDTAAVVLAMAAYTLPQIEGWIQGAKRVTPAAHVVPPIAR